MALFNRVVVSGRRPDVESVRAVGGARRGGGAAPGVEGVNDRFTYLSLGAGVQSSALLVMSALGLRDCPKAEVAIFADTQDEPKWVYEQVAALAEWGATHGLPVV